MIFKNKKAFIIERFTNHKTNTKSYEDLKGDFIFEATFKLKDTKLKNKEYCVLSREGYNMGIFIQDFNGENFIKWVWWETDENNEQIYNDLFVHRNLDLTILNTIKVIKKDDVFTMYINDELYDTRTIKNKIYDYSDKYVFVGAGNPFCKNNNECWFSGEITDVKVYNTSNEIVEDLFLWYDFKKISNFKVFDKSGNGNHGVIFEPIKLKNKKSKEFNKLGRPAKIV